MTKGNYYILKSGLMYDWCRPNFFGNPPVIRFVVKCTRVSWRTKTFHGIVVESNLSQIWNDVPVCCGTHDEWDMSLFIKCSDMVYNREEKLKELLK